MYNYYCNPHMYMYPMMPLCPMVYEENFEKVCPEESDEDLKELYPKIYFKVYPIINNYCNKLEKETNIMYCPTEDKMDDMCKEIHEKIKSELYETEEDCMRGDGYRIYNPTRDLIRIIFIDELLNRRRRRRRRRRHDHRRPWHSGRPY
ncbi:hypothetical protein [Clostridium niameyense]|uniref:hypothetical protein n=1 Tax=Clostridium niameyense TaxID=1622073 RepID=UPI00067F4E2A|nr:hypothetical protein [Clostridium niameyense]